MKKPFALLISATLLTLVVPTLAQEVASTIMFTSTRDNTTAARAFDGGEIYFIDYLTNDTFAAPVRVTFNEIYGDGFPTVSPDGKGKIVFDSNRFRGLVDPANTSDLFLMNHDGTDQVYLTRGGSPSWAPPAVNERNAKVIAFHASASGVGRPINTFPGSATEDSDIFIVNVDDLLEHRAVPLNLTSDRVATVDDDPNWSPDGQKIVFTSYVNDPSTTVTPAEIYMMNADGSGVTQMTSDGIEKRGPAWSPDGTRILFACRMGPENAAGLKTFEICVMNAVPNGATTRLTFNAVGDLTPTWSPDGQYIVSHRTPANQLWVMRADGSAQRQITTPPGLNLLATSWGVIRVGQYEQ